MHGVQPGWRVLRVLLGVAAGVMAALTLVAWRTGNPYGAMALGLGAAVLAPLWALGPRAGSLSRLGNLLALVLVAVLTCLSWIRGGLAPSITTWLIIVPMAASMLGRTKVALAWAGVAIGVLTLLSVAEWQGWAPGRSSPLLIVRWGAQVGLVTLSLWLVHRVRVLARERQKLVSERAVAGQKLESLGRLAGGIAHDFNNVLAVVMARVDDAMQGIDPEDASYADLHAIRTAAKRGASLASELVAFSRRGPATYDVLRPAEVLHAAQQVFGRLVRENVQIEVEADESVPPIEGDRDHLLQVLLNLALNAQDAMPQGGRMQLQLWSEEISEPTGATTGVIPPGRYAVMSVTDEGSGMTPEIQARVFEPFFTTKDRGLGSGIGLATVHAIITQHGGHVRLSSNPGAGSTFEVFLPLTSRTDELQETTDDLHDGAGASLRVLLVEDDALVRRALQVMLSRAGHKVVPAANGAEALARWEETTAPFDVVLTDVLMPGMTGPDVVRQLRHDEPGLRVVYMSGHVDDAMRDVDLERERALFVRKPASRAALLSALEQAAAGTTAPSAAADTDVGVGRQG